MSEYHQYLKGPQGETWQAALVRFKQLCHTPIVQQWEDEDGNRGEEHIDFSRVYDNGTLFELARKEPIENIATYEKNYAMTVPPELVALLCDHGPFVIHVVSSQDEERLGGRMLLDIYNSNNVIINPNIKPLCEAVYNNMGYDVAGDMLTKQQQEYLDSHYFCFGTIFLEDDGNLQYLYFDKNHQFGSWRFVSDDYAANMEELTPLLAGTATAQTLDSLMSASMDKVISLQLDYSEIYPEND